jgi:hypothetical protein
MDSLSAQGIGLRPHPWAGISRPVGPVIVEDISTTVSYTEYIGRSISPARIHTPHR